MTTNTNAEAAAAAIAETRAYEKLVPAKTPVDSAGRAMGLEIKVAAMAGMAEMLDRGATHADVGAYLAQALIDVAVYYGAMASHGEPAGGSDIGEVLLKTARKGVPPRMAAVLKTGTRHSGRSPGQA